MSARVRGLIELAIGLGGIWLVFLLTSTSWFQHFFDQVVLDSRLDRLIKGLVLVVLGAPFALFFVGLCETITGSNIGDLGKKAQWHKHVPLILALLVFAAVFILVLLLIRSVD